METVVVRSLTREYRISTASAAVLEILRFIECAPEMPAPACEVVELLIETVPDGFHVNTAPQAETHGSAIAVLNSIFLRIFTGIQDEAPSAPLVHGACLRYDGRRLVLVGAKGAGKSTLTLHLLASGFDIEGDEHVVVLEDSVIARPRRLRVKPGSLPLVPRLADAVLASPSFREEDIELYSVDPSKAGRPWQIRGGQVDHLIFLDPNHGGKSAVTPLDTGEAMRRILEHCILPSSQRAKAAARLRQVALTARSWRLMVGELDQAEALLRAVVLAHESGE